MNDLVKVSVIIPNYNHQDYLEQRIASVLDQTYQDFEIILLDDASTDNSQDVLLGYSNHPKVANFIINETNSGSVFKQWVKGIELAKGDYVWIAESDDYAHVDFLMETIQTMEAEAHISMVFTDTRKVDGCGQPLRLVSESKSLLADLGKGEKIINTYN